MEYKIGFSSKQLSSSVNSGQLGHGNGTMSPWTVQVCTNVRHREVSLNFPIIGVNIWIELFFFLEGTHLTVVWMFNSNFGILGRYC